MTDVHPGLVSTIIAVYNRPELAAAHDRYWALIHRNLHDLGEDSPEELSQSSDLFGAWTRSDLVLSQTCGMPYRLELKERVSLIGTPDFGLRGCPPGYYRSAIVVRTDDARETLGDFASARLAYNELTSQSGYCALVNHVRPLGFWFAETRSTGGHEASAHAVANGRADIASLDAVSWGLLQRHDPLAVQLRVLDWTAPTPGLPYISRIGANVDMLFEAIRSAIHGLDPIDRQALGLRDLVSIPASAYLAVPNP